VCVAKGALKKKNVIYAWWQCPSKASKGFTLSDSRRLDARGGMDPNKWPDKAKEAYNYGVTGFGTGWQRQFLVRGLNPKP